MKILFVCLGNICRSPMAEMICKQIVREKHLERYFEIASAATSGEETGNPVYPPARRVLAAHGIPCEKRGARRIVQSDYTRCDMIIGMDRSNIRSMDRFFGGDPSGKIRMLLEFDGSAAEVSDPWYTGDFERAYDDIYKGCAALIETLENENGLMDR